MKKYLAIGFIAAALAILAAIVIAIQIEKKNSGHHDYDFAASVARGDLRREISDIENYRNVFKRYPVDLRAMRGGIDFIDNAAVNCNPGDSGDYFYKVADDGLSYELFSKGPDCKPYTSDDIFPTLTIVEAKAIGYRGKTDPNSEEILRPARLQSCNGT